MVTMLMRLSVLWALLLGLLLPVAIAAQTTEQAPAWKVTAVQQESGTYLLRFTTRLPRDWQLYAPDQVLLDMPAASLQFADSSVRVEPKFSFTPLPVSVSSELLGQPVQVQEGSVTWEILLTINGEVPASLQGQLLYTYGHADELYPSTAFAFEVALPGGKKAASLKKDTIDLLHPVSDCGDQAAEQKSLWQIFLLGILGGLIALLTPCVFPMVPVTVTFFTKKSLSRRAGIVQASLYGFFIFLIYVLITLPFHVAGSAISPEIFNNISTNVWLNLLFFVVFVVFALSFFGLYEIGLPSTLANRADARSGLGNIAGIFFMASTLAIVSFSCTGPILGTLLVGVAEQGAWPLTAGAAGFGLALGLPFALFALFPHWLQSLPRSGGWMTELKVVLGFIELALAIKFLSNADLVEQWGLLKRELFFACWIVIGIALFLYLGGWLRRKETRKPLTIGRGVLMAAVAAFTLYLMPGITNTHWAERKLISGFPPPLSYSIYAGAGIEQRSITPIHNDYQAALVLARQQQKPVLIDFTGWACVNCRRMEEKVWPDPQVDSLMRHAFVVVSLYVDERNKLPLTERQVIDLPDGSRRTLVTVGDKWASFQIQNFGATSQPQYVMVSPDEKLLARPKFYTPDPAEFARWLQCGLASFKAVQ